MGKPLRFLLLVVICGVPLHSLAATSCSVLTPNGSTLIDFGMVSSAESSANNAQGLFSFSCTNLNVLQPQITYRVKIGPGLSGNFNTRQMAHLSGARLNYNLYTDVQRTQIFGDGSAGTNFTSGSCLATCIPVINVYGQMPPGQSGPSGDYQDTVTVTLEFD